VIVRDDKVQLSVTGKGGKVRQVLLPETVSKSLLALRGDAGANDPVFASGTGDRLKQRAIGYMIKGAARRASIDASVSAHWLRHAHGSHSLDRGATLAEVQATLGHANVATTLSACSPEYLERAQAGRGHFSLRKTTAFSQLISANSRRFDGGDTVADGGSSAPTGGREIIGSDRGTTSITSICHRFWQRSSTPGVR
jgi:Phage integrase family